MLHENIIISQCAITVFSYVFNMLILTSSWLIMVLQCSTLKSQFIIMISLCPIICSQCWTDIMIMYWVIKSWRCAITLPHGAFTVLNLDNTLFHGGIVMFIVHSQCWPGLFLFYYIIIMSSCDITMSLYTITMVTFDLTILNFLSQFCHHNTALLYHSS